MKHSKFIKLYEARERNGTWENWRERHRHEPQLAALGELSHYLVCQLKDQLPKGCTNSTEGLQEFLISKYNPVSSYALKPQLDPIPNQVIEALLKASGLRWFKMDNGRHYVHWDCIKHHENQATA